MKKVKKDILVFTVCLTLLWLAVLPLFHPGLFPTFDNISVVRIEEMAKELKNGQFPVRHVADLGKHRGYMLFNFYAPLPFYFSAALHLLGVNLVGALKRAFLVAFIIGMVSMFLLAKRFFGRLGGAVAAIFFVFSSYFGFDVYTRGGLGEVWALALSPFVFWSYFELSQKKDFIWVFLGATSLAALILSHNLTAYMVIPFLIAWLIFWGWRSKSRGLILISFLLGFGLSAFFWLPAMAEKSLIWVTYTQRDFQTFQEGLLHNLKEFLFPFPPAKFNFLYFVIPMLVGPYALLDKKIKLISRKAILISFGFFIISFFMCWGISALIWKLFFGFLYIFQFPWRFFIIATLFASFLAGAFVYLLPKKLSLILSIFLVALVIFVNLGNFRPKTYEFVDKYTPDDPCGTSWGYEYFPTWVKVCLKKDPNIKYEIVSGKAVVKEVKIKPRNYEIQVEGEDQSRLRLQEYYYPGWVVFIDDKKTTIDYNNLNGLIEVLVPAGNHMITAKFSDTPIRKSSNIISLSSLIVLLFWGVYFRRR